MFNIGNLKLKNQYFLAPMVGVNDIAFRILCKSAGAGLVYTGMINPLTREDFNLDDNPALQLFSQNEIGIEKFIKAHPAPLYDFNLGCSAHIAEKNCFGAFLPKKPEAIKKILEAMKTSKKPLTIKIRKSNDALKIIKVAEKYCDAVCIHPRTSAQGYSGKPDVDFALKIKQKTSLPIIYSGDVDENNANELLKQFDFVMIGRKAMGNPNVFAKLTGGKESDFNDYLKLALKYGIKFSQIKMQAMYFTKNHYGAGDIRQEISKANTLKELNKITRIFK